MLLIVLSTVLVVIALLPVWRNREKFRLNDVHRAMAPGRFVDLSLGKVHYQLQGNSDAPLVVLVHGFSAPSYMWDNTVPALHRAGYCTLTFDLYGRGFSDRPDTKYDKRLFVAQIEELVEQLAKGRSFHIVGLSMGGAITSAYIAQYPEKILSVSYIAPLNQPVDLGPLTMPIVGRWLGYSFFIPSLPQHQSNDLVHPERFPQWQSQFEQQMQYSGFRRAIINTARDLISKDPGEDFRSVGQTKLRKLVLWGKNDKVIPIEDAQRVVEMLGKNTDLRVFENAGHAMQYEAFERINAALVSHLSA